MDKETENLKWWDHILISLVLLAIVSTIASVVILIFQGYSERVELRKLSITQTNLNILKTKYEIMRLSCDKRGGRFIEKDWSIECN